MTDPVRLLRPVQSASTALPQNDHQNVAGLIITAGTPLLTKRPTCSQCRIRKVRCDGQQSICGNCQRLRFECSFQQNTATVARSDYVLKVPEARRRMQACVPCHDKKTRCLGELPSCTNCLRKGRACVYPKIKKAPPASRSRDATEQQNTSNGRSPTGGTGDSAASSQGPATSQLDKNLTASLVEDYFRHLYPLPAFSFLHKPTLIQRCEDDTINEQLKLAICAITALHLQSSHLSHERWVNQAENSILQHIGQPSIFHLQSLFLIVRYRIESGGFPKAFMLAGLAARTAVALRLNYERRDLSYVAQEARRRLYWSLYLLDDYFCVGLREFELCPEETIHLQLPCPEEVFAAGGHSSTGFLHPGSSEPVESIGLHASYLRVTAARRANMRFIRRVGLGEESPATLRNSIQSLEQNLTSIHASMGDLGTYSATTLTSTQWQAEYLMLHISWHQCHCDLYRSFIDSYSEAAPVAVLEGLEPQDRAVLQRKCVEHAQTIIHILSDFFLHGNDLCQLERDVAVCAFEAARIVMFDCRRTGLAAMMEEALGKANLCLELIARHFGFSASTQPLWKEFTRLVENYTARKVIQEREEEGVANADSQPPSPRSTRLSQIATARQKLSVQSLLLQSDFVDDSADIVAPYGKVVSATPATIADSSSHLNVTKRKPSTSPFETSRDSAPPRSIPETAHLLMPGQEIAMGDLAATPGPPSWKVPAVPNGVGVMMDNFTGSAAPTVITPSSNSFFAAASAATVVTVGPSTLPVAMDTSSAAPAEPGFDQGFVFNPWMGLSGNEDLRVYSELAVGSNEEY